jgi:hypothetical protein
MDGAVGQEDMREGKADCGEGLSGRIRVRLKRRTNVSV